MQYSEVTGNFIIYKSTDFGTTWTAVYTADVRENIGGMVICDTGDILTVGSTSGAGTTIYSSRMFGVKLAEIDLRLMAVSPAASFGKAYVDGGGTNWYRCTNGTTWSAW
jgi:hypothetical protein